MSICLNERRARVRFAYDHRMLKLAQEVVSRIDEDIIPSKDDLEEALIEAIEATLIQTEDIWHIMAFYQDPADANLLDAKDAFFLDLEASIELN